MLNPLKNWDDPHIPSGTLQFEVWTARYSFLQCCTWPLSGYDALLHGVLENERGTVGRNRGENTQGPWWANKRTIYENDSVIFTAKIERGEKASRHGKLTWWWNDGGIEGQNSWRPEKFHPEFGSITKKKSEIFGYSEIRKSRVQKKGKNFEIVLVGVYKSQRARVSVARTCETRCCPEFVVKKCQIKIAAQ